MNNKITITDEQAENARMAYAIMAGIPAELIDLNDIREGYASDEEMLDCNSCGCVAGWLSVHPFFQEKGLKSYAINGVYPTSLCGVDLSKDVPLFGSSYIFNSHEGIRDSQKREALERIRLHLLMAGRITKQRSDELAVEEEKLGD